MAEKLISACDHSLTEMFTPLGLVRFARAVYAQSSDDVIWRGIWVTFNSRHGILVAQPNVGIFCPAAEKLVSEGLKVQHGREPGRSHFGKLRAPVLTHPLYSLVRDIIGEDRLPPAYHVVSAEQIEEVCALIRDDFVRAGWRFLDPIDTLSELRNRLMKDGATGARMYAIAVTYLMNEHITPDEIDETLGPQPNVMSRDFAEYFRKKFVGTRRQVKC